MNSVDLNTSSVQLFETQHPVQLPNSSAVQPETDEGLKTLRANASGIDFKPVAIGEGTSDSLISEETRNVLAEMSLKYHAAELQFEFAPLRAAFTSMNSSLAENNGDYSGLADRLGNFQEGMQGILANGIEFNPANPFLRNEDLLEELVNILPDSTDGEPNDLTGVQTWVLQGKAAENAGLAGINVLTFDFSEMLEGDDAESVVSVLGEAVASWQGALDQAYNSISVIRDEKIAGLSQPAEPVDSEAAANVDKDMNLDLAREKAQHVQTELAKQVFSLVNATSPSALASFSL
ncbi:hypothetical protein PsAD46_02098 [Pseudovibrio sp. Ad46]|uniref:hypothetical protein n=1 Tax=unclassified Pseudovibrio TaxID=2627060 RepID=UPI0007AEAFA3|nr:MULTISPECIES: hypothetical protein [unclassified Pseudovibrio]KZK90477.1 hypothetical protein PsAD46_02098 [Pseudovibrio sp. Ad46]KZK92801.1 hypothetical protein PsAD5_03522 [Pseudovibrio sp. Ad5]